MSTNTLTAQWTAWHFVASLNLLSLVGLRCLNLGCFWNEPGLMRLTMNCFMEELNHQGFLVLEGMATVVLVQIPLAAVSMMAWLLDAADLLSSLGEYN